MPNNSGDGVKDYLVTGVKKFVGYLSDTYEDNINRADEEGYSDGIQVGIRRTVAALYDTDVNDNEIIRVLLKFWGIDKADAERRLLREKWWAAVRELEQYLKIQGYSDTEIEQFMKSNNTVVKIHDNRDLWKLRRNPEKLLKAVQDSE